MRAPVALLVAALALGGARASSAAPAAPATPEEFLAAKGASVVNVATVLKVRLAFGSQSFEQEAKVDALGTIVDPTGLVMVSNGVVGGDTGGVLGAMARFLPPGVDLKLTPTSVKVVVGGDGVEREAVIVARDANLGLAFVRLLEDPATPLPAVDLKPGSEPRLGQRLLAVGRKSRGFDYAPLLVRLYPSRRVERPRKASGVAGDYMIAGLASAAGNRMSMTQFAGGTPAYDADGRTVGILSSLFVAGESQDDMDSLDVLLPLDAVSRALDAARALVPAALEKARKGE